MPRPARTWLPGALMAAFLFTSSSAAANPERWRLEGWTGTDFGKSAIDFSEILSGGPPRDGIPSIDNPKFMAVGEIDYIAATEPVIGLALNGEARAYPLRILIWHEIVNDEIGSTPVSVTYCPLCNSAVVFDRRVGGRVLDFGTTGKLRMSDLVMYDRQTESWWQQFTGTAIIGELTGTELKSIPARMESLGQFRARYPDGKVLVPNTDSMRAYGRNPYEGYDTAAAPFLYDGAMPEGIEPMARVVVVRSGKEPEAVTLEALRKAGKISLGDVTLTWSKGQNSALDTREINKGRDVGNVVAQRKTATGTEDVVYDVTFAFVFHAFHPELAIRKN